MKYISIISKIRFTEIPSVLDQYKTDVPCDFEPNLKCNKIVEDEGFKTHFGGYLILYGENMI